MAKFYVSCGPFTLVTQAMDAEGAALWAIHCWQTRSIARNHSAPTQSAEHDDSPTGDQPTTGDHRVFSQPSQPIDSIHSARTDDFRFNHARSNENFPVDLWRKPLIKSNGQPSPHQFHRMRLGNTQTQELWVSEQGFGRCEAGRYDLDQAIRKYQQLNAALDHLIAQLDPPTNN